MGPGVFYSWNGVYDAWQSLNPRASMGPGVFYSWNRLGLTQCHHLTFASMGPGVFYSWNYNLRTNPASSASSFNGARSFLLLELLSTRAVARWLVKLQWGQEFFTPGIQRQALIQQIKRQASMGPGVFYSWNKIERGLRYGE